MLGKPLAQVRGNYCHQGQLMCFDRTGEPAGKTLRREKNLDVSPGRISRIWLTEAPGEYHHSRQQRGPPVHSLLVTAGVPPRHREACRWRMIVYFGVPGRGHACLEDPEPGQRRGRQQRAAR
jgi:hypothetical protein